MSFDEYVEILHDKNEAIKHLEKETIVQREVPPVITIGKDGSYHTKLRQIFESHNFNFPYELLNYILKFENDDENMYSKLHVFRLFKFLNKDYYRDLSNSFFKENYIKHFTMMIKRTNDVPRSLNEENVLFPQEGDNISSRMRSGYAIIPSDRE